MIAFEATPLIKPPALRVVSDFADVNGDTLVLVLADHECAGFSIIGALAGKIDTLKMMASDAAKLDPATQPGRQSMVGVYEAAGFPKYTIAADGYPQTLDVDGKILIGYGASGDRYESWLTNPLPSPSVDSLPTSIAGELSTKGYPALPVDRAKEMGYYMRGQAGGNVCGTHSVGYSGVSLQHQSHRARAVALIWRRAGKYGRLLQNYAGHYGRLLTDHPDVAKIRRKLQSRLSPFCHVALCRAQR